MNTSLNLDSSIHWPCTRTIFDNDNTMYIIINSCHPSYDISSMLF